MGSLLAVDPGSWSLGWALWKEFKPGKAVRPDAFGLVLGHEELRWWERAHRQAEDLVIAVADLVKPQRLKVVCEMPIFFAGTSGGVAAAETNSLQKLCFQVGTIGYAFMDWHSEFLPVPVSEWKGQLPKKVVNQRITRMLGEKACADFKKDVWDAVGIGLWAKGVFK